MKVRRPAKQCRANVVENLAGFGTVDKYPAVAASVV
ncbi:hypothetical protein FHX76_000286 [Lysinibacter cavernae]|uniref:Uncharacterized protein n=1 Tax=Lysinibacter cavernae TaxID=1640652 RepID=A0A7X5TSN4_9MICO|nr:hypothetical protein [Lysinibacter cavernae]